jgi:hypothetical protein
MTRNSSSLPKGVLAIGEGFWNIRGSFKLGGIVDVGTQASVVRLGSGRFLLLDACGLSEPVAAWLDTLTDGGAAIEAVLHLHPFHTLSVRALHEKYPRARLHGTARHAAKAPDLPWDTLRTESPELHALYAADLELTVPRGVDFIPADEQLHFASVLAIHRASRTLHVDDTLNCISPPRTLARILPPFVRFHPTLGRVLERRRGAAADFRLWARDLAAKCSGVEHLCAAHVHAVPAGARGGTPVARRIEHALAKAEPTLRAHEAKFG